ncbi:MAG: mechanosensitive ion channel family protein [Elainellaceae cyanobacterium]
MNELIQTVNDSLLELVGQAVQIFPALIVAIIVLVITRFSIKPIRQIVGATAEQLIQSPSLQTLIVQVVTVSTWVIGILIACLIAFPDLGLGDLIGLLGLGSVAVGFAFQDIFKNFLAGILLLLNEPFKLNDQIIVEDYEGTVEAINIRSTAIRTYQGEQVVIPNSIVFTSPIRVLTEYESRRTDLAIGLDYNTPLPRARQVLQMALVDVDGILASPLPEVDVVGFGDSSIDFVVRYWTLPQIVYVRQTKTRVMLALKQSCDEAGLNIPYPIRTVYFFDQDKYDDRHPATNGAGSTSTEMKES